jgi:hypothetical protein
VAGFTTMAVISLAGMAVSAYGQYKAGQSAKKAGEAAETAAKEVGKAEQRAAYDQAGLADYNAQVADLQAADATARGQEEASRYRVGVRGMIGSQRAGFAGAGVEVGFGSAVDVQADAAFLGELDALTIRTNAAREAWGFQVQSEDLRRRAAIARKEGDYAAETGIVRGAADRAAGNAASTASKFAIASTLIGGGSSLLSQRYGFASTRSAPPPRGFDANMIYAGRY